MEVADLAIDSEKSLSESDLQARLVFRLAMCLMVESNFLLRSLFFLLKTGRDVVVFAFAKGAGSGS